MRELHDHFFKQAKRDGYRSRAAYKLIEIADKKQLLAPGDRVLDCGAAPGSWLQVAWERVRPNGLVVGIDLQRIARVASADGVHIVEGDFVEIPDADLLAPLRPGERFNVVLSDMAPSTTGDRTIDHHGSIRLAQAVMTRCSGLLAPGGAIVVKVFEGEAYPDLLAAMRERFGKVKGYKPSASRAISREMYVISQEFEPPADAPEEWTPPAQVRRGWT